MASSTLFITLVIFLSPIFVQLVIAQVPGTTTSTCASMLLSLAPCGPYVQGFVQLPAQPCCDGLNQIYSQQPTCLCLFLNNTSTLSPAFPINQTLALQLPPLCNIPADASSCSSSSSSSSSPGGKAPSDSSSVAPPPSPSTGSHNSQGAKNKSGVAGKDISPECFNICISKEELLRSQYESVDFHFTLSATPVAQVAARPTSFMGLGFGPSSSASKSKIQLIISALVAILPGTIFFL